MIKVPVIDLTPARTGGKAEKLMVAEQINQACKEIGFFTVVGHGIDRKVFDTAYKTLTDFFAMPLEQKQACTTDNQPSPHQINGYSALLEENVHAYMGRKNMPSDYVEKFSMGRWVLDDSKKDQLPFPEGEFGEQLRQAMQTYYKSCLELTTMLTHLFALAVDLPEDFFDDKIDDTWDYLRFQTYPGFQEDFDNRQGIADHTDGSLITILTDTSDGLEVKTRDGQWIKPTTDSIDQFCVNIGDPMMRWSNDEWVSTPHRVTLKNKPRQSIIFFKLINDDTRIETFPKFCEDKPSKYEPVIFRDYILEKTNELFK